jgi:hypothetical protein
LSIKTKWKEKRLQGRVKMGVISNERKLDQSESMEFLRVRFPKQIVCAVVARL